MDLGTLFQRRSRPDRLSILTVCTGNICRSPLTEKLLASKLDGLPVVVSSSGTHALVGQGMPIENVQIAKNLGVQDSQSHSARQLTAEHITNSSFVLALTREHRKQIVELVPKASRYTFTLREFARIADAITTADIQMLEGSKVSERLHNVVELVSQLRGSVPAEEATDDDVVDPYQQPFEIYAEQTEQIVPAVNTIAKLLLNVFTSESFFNKSVNAISFDESRTDDNSENDNSENDNDKNNSVVIDDE